MNSKRLGSHGICQFCQKEIFWNYAPFGACGKFHILENHNGTRVPIERSCAAKALKKMLAQGIRR